MAEPDKPAKVKTEGSARVLNEVKGRLEHLEAGEMPVIERVGPDGTSRRVDHTGEMVRPEPVEDPAMRAAAEAFAAEHSAGKAGSVAPKAPTKKSPPPPDSTPVTKEPAKQGFFARILALFRRS